MGQGIGGAKPVRRYMPPSSVGFTTCWSRSLQLWTHRRPVHINARTANMDLAQTPPRGHICLCQRISWELNVITKVWTSYPSVRFSYAFPKASLVRLSYSSMYSEIFELFGYLSTLHLVTTHLFKKRQDKKLFFFVWKQMVRKALQLTSTQRIELHP